MKTAALIPCRTGSKGVPNKNFKDFCGKPLFKWTQEAAMASDVFDKIIISSDGWTLTDDKPPEEFENEFKKYYGIVEYDKERPAELATDEARLDPLLLYYAKKYPEIELWCLLQPTSPLRTAKDIQKAHKMALKERYASVLSVYPEKGFYWVKDAVGFQGKKLPVATYNIDKRPNRQDRKDWYAENGAIYFTKTYALNATEIRCGGGVGLYIMPKERSYEIDSPTDWAVAEFIKRGCSDGMA